MTNKELTLIDHKFLESVAEVLAQARKNAKTAVNLSMVYAYFEIGKMIVEEEQHGANRAAYGARLLKELSAYLTGKYGKGFSVGNLKTFDSSTESMRMTKLAKQCLANSITFLP